MMEASAVRDEIRRMQTPNLQLEQDDLVIFGEDGKFHYVQKAQYMRPEHRLPEKYRSAPEFLVRLGAVVADINVFKSVQVNDSQPVKEQKQDSVQQEQQQSAPVQEQQSAPVQEQQSAPVQEQQPAPAQKQKLDPLTGKCSCILLNVAAIRKESVKRAGHHAPAKNGSSTELPRVTSGQQNGREPQMDDLVIFGEDGEFYLVERGLYEAQELPEGMESAPLLMVELGVVVADIPRLPTAGSACYLVNLASIRKGPEQTTQRILQHKAGMQ